MPKNRLLLISLATLMVVLATIVFAPFVVSNWLRVWLHWQAHRQHLTIELGKIAAHGNDPGIVGGRRGEPDEMVVLTVERARTLISGARILPDGIAVHALGSHCREHRVEACHVVVLPEPAPEAVIGVLKGAGFRARSSH